MIVIPYLFSAAKSFGGYLSRGSAVFLSILHTINHHPNPLVRIAFVISMQIISVIGISVLINKLEKVEQDDKKSVIVLAELKCIIMCTIECYFTPSVALAHICNLAFSLLVHNTLFQQVSKEQERANDEANPSASITSKIIQTLTDTIKKPQRSTDFIPQIKFAEKTSWQDQLIRLFSIIKDNMLIFLGLIKTTDQGVNLSEERKPGKGRSNSIAEPKNIKTYTPQRSKSVDNLTAHHMKENGAGKSPRRTTPP